MKRTNPILGLVLIMVSFSAALSFSNQLIVCIDPGHGGIHSGTVGRVYGLLEKDVNLGVGLKAWHYFGLTNWNPIMTRYEDIHIDRPHRANIANAANGGEGVDAFLCIHHNAPLDTTDTLTNGTVTSLTKKEIFIIIGRSKKELL